MCIADLELLQSSKDMGRVHEKVRDRNEELHIAYEIFMLFGHPRSTFEMILQHGGRFPD